MHKTLAMRLLEGKSVPYEAVSYPETERDAEKVAELLGVASEQVFKTLVVVRERGKPYLVMVPASAQLDLKKMAKAIGEKKLFMASHSQAEQLTGLEVGGISALALINRGFDVVLDEAARSFAEIYISAGQKGINIRVPVADLVKLTRARWQDVSE